MTLAELIERLGGRLAHGAAEQSIAGVSALEKARSTDLVFAQDEASAAQALASRAAAVVLKPGALASYASNSSIAVIESEQPRLWFARAAKLLRPEPPCAGIHPTAAVDAGAELASSVTVGAQAVIGKDANVDEWTRIDVGAVIGEGVRIGKHCHIYPRVVLYPGTTIGNQVVVHAGAVLGADGFGYARDAETGAYTQFPQQGVLAIEDDVEIGANSTIDRGALGETRIGRGTKIDNLVHVGHNCDVGEDVILVALTGISGSSSIGKGALLAGQVGVGDHVRIGPGVVLGGQAGVFSGATVTNEGLKPGTVLYGTPARPLRQVLREQAVLARLAKTKSRKGSREE
jgi:UDP-3-O-[3-hydroxymyristoyl] glucosamine N-acyltransferase